jgi:hypothetical protein
MKQEPGVVIAARQRLVSGLAQFGGRPIPESTREAIADWLIRDGLLAESYFTNLENGDGHDDSSL